MTTLRFVTRLCVLIVLVACSKSHFLAPVPGLGGVPPPGKIKHIVFIVQENRTFDNLFGGPNPFPGADAASSGQTSTGTTPLVQGELECTYTVFLYKCPRQDPNNYHQPWLLACNPVYGPPFLLGRPSPCRMNGFDKDQTADLDPNQVYSYIDYAESKPYWDIARAYTLGDRFFMGHNSESYTAHQYIFSGQSNNVVDGPVYPNPTPGPTNIFITPWGCDSPAGTTTFQLDPNSGQETASATGPLPCFAAPYKSLADLVNQDPKLSWRLYAYSVCQNINALDVNRSIRYSALWPSAVESSCPNSTSVKTANFRAPEDSFLTDVADSNDTLASVTWILPGAITSDHPGVPFGYCGPWWVASVVDAIGKSKYWDSTVIFIFWDDWGGFYDHVPPYVVRDQAGPGFRVPLMVVSPYARRGQVIHTSNEFATLLRFAEENFGLGSLDSTDNSPFLGDLSAYFDWNNPQPFVNIPIPNFAVCNAPGSRAQTMGAKSRWLRMINDN
jgi:phospholipase C